MSETVIRRTILLASTAISLGVVTPAWAQGGEDIIVTARRVEERLQDVPISITVLNQEQLQNNNITNTKDLATVTPGLQVNSRYGSDATNFSIRGFTQEQRTSATVGTYFGDVVAPRGSGATFGGDGAGPGALFDLQNVQVLKGPQGTLQGRNATGGAVLLVPRKPTGRFEGYVEGSAGDYDLRRIQAVVNVPILDTLRVRFGLDRQTRDGYLRNIGLLGDGAYGNVGMGNVDYWAGRASIVADLTPNLENYTIVSYTKTRSNGVIPKTVSCIPAGTFGGLCAGQLAREARFDPWTVSNRLANSQSTTEQWQIINSLTWQASDSLTIKNIMAYGQFRSVTNLDLFGNYFPTVAAGTETSGGQVTGFAFTSADPFSGKTNAQQSFIEELQFQGRPGDGSFVWQAGLYAELNDPLGFSGVQTATFGACADIATLNCAPGGFPNFTRSATKFRDYAVYGQASYNFTDKLKLTIGGRYTWDKQISRLQIENVALPSAANGFTTTVGCTNVTDLPATRGIRYPAAERAERCLQTKRKDTEAPTWLIGLDYKPIDDVLLYAKWSRGYRQGGVSMFSPDTTQTYDKETVDTFEVGSKANWRGAVPGTFNVAAFYNKFKDQQLLLGVTGPTASPSASIVNAGKSYMYGVEAELSVRPFQGLSLNVSYSYLKTKLQQFISPPFAPGSIYTTITPPIVGGEIPNSIPHKVNISGNYALPLPESVGKVSVGATYVYTSSYGAVADSCPAVNPAAGCTAALLNPGGGTLPAANLLNLNINWENVAGAPVDLGLFMTNVTNEVNYLSVNDNSTRGFVSRIIAEPRMFGARLRYRFGS